MLLKTNAPGRHAMLVRLTLAVVGMALLVLTWFRLLRWAAQD